MKKKVLMLVAAFFMGGIVTAQQAGRGDKMSVSEVRAERMTKRMVKEYSLNDAQKKQLMEANLTFVEKMGDRPMHCSAGMGKGKKTCGSYTCSQAGKQAGKECKVAGEKCKKPQLTAEQCANRKVEMQKQHEEIKAARAVYDTQLQKILTKSQYAAYSKKMQDRKAKMESKRKEAGKA